MRREDNDLFSFGGGGLLFGEAACRCGNVFLLVVCSGEVSVFSGYAPAADCVAASVPEFGCVGRQPGIHGGNRAENVPITTTGGGIGYLCIRKQLTRSDKGYGSCQRGL